MTFGTPNERIPKAKGQRSKYLSMIPAQSCHLRTDSIPCVAAVQDRKKVRPKLQKKANKIPAKRKKDVLRDLDNLVSGILRNMRQIHEKVGVSKALVSLWLRRKRYLSIEQWIAIKKIIRAERKQ